MKPEYLTFRKLIENRQFRIPDYQRPYSWKSQQRSELFRDLQKLNEQPSDRHHFMATIVCAATGQEQRVGKLDLIEVSEVVDGQQRLTTLLILMKAFALTLRSEDEKVADQIDQFLVRGDEGLVLLQTNHDEAGIFSGYLRDGFIPEGSKLTTHSARNLSKALLECHHFARQQHSKDPLKATELLGKILNNIGLIYYEVDNTHSVYTVFELLNSRGLAVDWLDKCKSILMGAADEANVSTQTMDEIKTVWSRIYREIGVEDVPGDEIMRFAATFISSSRPSTLLNTQEAFDLIKERAGSAASEPLGLSRLLEDVVRKRVRLEVQYMRTAVGHIVHARFLWIAIELSKVMNQAERGLAKSLWEKSTFRVFGLHRNDSRTGKGVYARLAHQVYNGSIGADTIAVRIEALADGYDIESAIEKVKELDCYENWQAQLRYVLYEYERHFAQQQGAVIDNDIFEAIWASSANKSIEHIAPVEPGGSWNTLAQSLGDDYSRHVNRIGNLCLLTPVDNSRAKNRSFEIKREVYAESGLPSVRRLSRHRNWGINQIAERETELVEWMQERWG